MARHRRDRRWLLGLERAALGVGLGLVGTYLVLLFGVRVMHPGFIFLNVFGIATALLRILVATVRDQSRVLLALTSRDPALRAAACRALELHREELLGPVLVNASPRQRALLEGADGDAVAEWMRDRVDWWRVGRVVLVLWVALFALLVAALLSVDPRIRQG